MNQDPLIPRDTLSQIKDELVRSAGWELGATLNFVTADESLGAREISFTDVVLLRLHGLVSLGGSVELFVGTDLLPKQPSYTDELAWQGALAGVRFSLGKGFAAWARGQVGPQLGSQGWLFL